jgi:transcriptional regulator with XRE-family HTH domain
VAQGLSLAELARRVGINNGTLSVLERGLTEPTISTIANIARELHVDLDALVQLNLHDDQLSQVLQTDEIPPDIRGHVRNRRTWPYIRALGKYVNGPATPQRVGRLLYELAKHAQAAIDESERSKTS